MEPAAGRSHAAWVYLLPLEVGPVSFAGEATPRLRADLAAAGFDVRYAGHGGPVDTSGARALIVAEPVDAITLRALVAPLPPGSPVILLPPAAGRRPDRAAAVCRAAGIEVRSIYATLPGAGTPRLLAPLESGAAFRGALELHATTTPRAAVLKAAILAASRTGMLRHLAPGTLVTGHTSGTPEPSFIDRLRADAGADGPAAILSPSAGAGTKMIARLSRADGTAVAYAKAASAGRRARDLHHEAEVLQALAADPPRAFRAPRCLSSGESRGHAFLLIEAMPGGGEPPLGEPRPELHRALVELARRGDSGTLTASTTWSETASAVESLRDGDAPLLRDALEQARALSGETMLPLGLAHRDLAGWNVRIQPGDTAILNGPVILDWEWARHRALPFLDLYHYVLHTHTHARGLSLHEAFRRHFGPGGASVRWLQAYGSALGLGDATARVARACLLLYLVDWYLLQRTLGSDDDTRPGSTGTNGGGQATISGPPEHLDLLRSLLAEEVA